MASLISRARATALTAILGAMCVSAAKAADMPFMSPLPAPPPLDQPVEFGTGWYLRGDVGYSNMPVPVVVADFVNNLGRSGAVSGGLGFGYQYNNWVRTDFEIDRAVFRPSAAQAPIWCPSGKVMYSGASSISVSSSSSSSSGSGTPVGYLYDPNETCTPDLTAHLNRTTPMFNAYIDLGNWWGFTPYVGAGIGASYLQSSSAVVFNSTANGLPWAPNLAVPLVPLQWITASGVYVTPPRALQFAQINPNQFVKKTTWKFSWNIMAGVSYDVTPNVKVDLHYRLLDAGSFTSLPSMLTLAPGVTKELISQEVRLGFRLTSD
jgi:opacity protein-like surface antigen